MTTKKLIPLLEKKLGEYTFGMFLRSARSMMGLTQVEMAKKLKMAPGTLCDIEKGRQAVSIGLATKIAKMAGLSIEQAVQTAIQDQLNREHLKLHFKII